MDKLIGILKIYVIKGTDLVAMDAKTSDPYVIISMGSQKVKTRVVKKNCNPVWNDEVSLAVDDLDAPIKLTVFDKDTFTDDDFMGEADIDIKPYIEYLRAELRDLPEGSMVSKVIPNRQNSLVEESPIMWKNGKLVQPMCLRLRNVPKGELDIEVEWIKVPGAKGLDP
uniref:C2 domain-containing protein n=1 Tax=Opuntia streptacantha TaxID=393608 RepID=A0A7C9D5B9_OPUST